MCPDSREGRLSGTQAVVGAADDLFQVERMPRYSYFLEKLDQPVAPRGPLWSSRLPLNRRAAAGLPSASPESGISIGEYFSAVRAYLEGPGKDAVAGALAAGGLRGRSSVELRLLLAKHGEYYHPCRVVAQAGGRQVEMVLNVAVSEAGRALAPKEFAILKRLHREVRPAYVPEVHGLGEVEAGRGALALVFLGQWFDGFHEFHLTRRGHGSGLELVVWDPDNGPRFPSPGQCREIYAQAARILTHYFNPATLECIGAWHHAAGDFVVNLAGSRPELRLVTVRDYRSVLRARKDAGGPSMDVRAVLEALLVFFLNTSIRMRLDRLDGVGDIAWSGPQTVVATLDGVLQALAEKPPVQGMPLPVDLLFKHALLSAERDDLRELCAAILAAQPVPPADIDRRLEEHVQTVAEALAGL
jgi:hypothetical protein